MERKSRSSLNEKKIDSVLEDFEPGDRVYFRSRGFGVTFGTVTDTSGGMLTIMEEGWPQTVYDVREFGGGETPDTSYISQWKKMPDVRQIQVGDTLSTTLPYYATGANTRDFFVVIETNGKDYMVLRHTDSSEYEVILKGGGNLDEYLQFWDLEG